MYVSYISVFRTGSFGISACMLAVPSESTNLIALLVFSQKLKSCMSSSIFQLFHKCICLFECFSTGKLFCSLPLGYMSFVPRRKSQRARESDTASERVRESRGEYEFRQFGRFLIYCLPSSETIVDLRALCHSCLVWFTVHSCSSSVV